MITVQCLAVSMPAWFWFPRLAYELRQSSLSFNRALQCLPDCSSLILFP